MFKNLRQMNPCHNSTTYSSKTGLFFNIIVPQICLSSRLLRRVDWCEFTNVSEVVAASIIRAICKPCARCIKHL
jgi:hypothetical protein